MPPTDLTDIDQQIRAVRDRHEIVDALYRFAAGQDLRDSELFLSAFAPDAQLDFTNPARRFGAEIPVMPDRDAIAGILATLAPLDTTHTVTNCRVVIDGDRAHLLALVEAQHVTRTTALRHLLLKNVYDVDLIRDQDRWVIRRMGIRNVWFDGDPTVLFSDDGAGDGTGAAPSRGRSTPGSGS
jgi:hypothetical protein